MVDLPTASQFHTRFPAFADVADATIEAAIAEAAGWVDDSWLERDYQPAIMYRAAHVLAAEGALNESGSTPSGATTGLIKSESLGDASVTYADRGGGASGSDEELASTPYGLRFLELRNANHPAVVQV